MAIRGLGIYVDKHFGALGGFSTRHRSNEFVTILPHSDIVEVESIFKDFVEDFRQRGIYEIWAGARKTIRSAECVEFAVLAGVAQGEPVTDVDFVIDAAKSQQTEIARLRCDVRR